MKIFKFGGSALQAKLLREKVIEIIKKEKDEKILLVVSAMGRSGFPYATDTLYGLINKEIMLDKSVARLISCGEIISSIVLENELKENQIKTISLSPKELGISLKGSYLSSEIESVDVKNIQKAFELNNVVIVPGFVGINKEGEIATFNRGGSDLTAIVLAKELSIDEVYLFKDVDGVYPTFPKVSSKIQAYKYLTYQEMILLNKLGFKVINDVGVIYAMNNNIKINIVNYQTNIIGTEIGDNSEFNDCIGFVCGNNYILIASFFPYEILEKIKTELKFVHIFIKDYQIEEYILTLHIPSSQIPVVRKKITSLFFNK